MEDRLRPATGGRSRPAPGILVGTVLSLLVTACGPGDGGAGGSAPGREPRATDATGALGSTGASAGRLHALFEEVWEWELREDPLLATSVGRHEYDDRLPVVRPADLRRRAERRGEFLERLQALDGDASGELGTADRISRDMLERRLELALRGFELGEHLLPFTSESGFHTALARLPDRMPLRTVEDHEDYLARLRAFPAYFDQQIGLLRLALERGMTQPRAVLAGFEATIEPHVVDDPTESVFWKPFRDLPTTFSDSTRDRLRAEGEAAIRNAVVPAYRAFLRFFLESYLPGARSDLAASGLPDGEAYYALQIRRYTTLRRTPREIHELGLGEVARIRASMDSLIGVVGFEGGFRAFLDHLRTDPRFYAESPGELLREAAWIAKRMDGKLPSLFGRLPRLPYGIEPVPDYLAPRYTSGRYVPPALGSDEPGIYWVNTHDLASRPLYALTALTLHEAVPGHHLQHALQIELEGLPAFRRHTYISAYGEGWGLYAERLGLEAGLYDTPYEHFGRLTYEMWRACRLVVDTGIHAFGWNRERARRYMADHTALSLHEIRTEVDRYVSWPGQALAYKLGEIEIRRLREEAREALGDGFDLRAFHDAVLRHGTVPLPVLKETVRAELGIRP